MSQRRGSSEKAPPRRGSKENSSALTPEPPKLDVMTCYALEMDRLGFACQTVSAVMYASVKAVCASFDDISFLDPPPNQYISFTDSSACKLPTSGEFSTFSSLFKEVLVDREYRSDSVSIEKDNEIDMLQLQCSLKATNGSANRIALPQYVSNVFAYERLAVIRNQINRLINSKDGFPLKSEDNIVERSLKESEMLTFTSLAATDLYKYHQLHEAEKMLNEVATPLPNFTGLAKAEGEGGNICKRRYVRHLSALSFSQILSKELIRDPMVLRKYYPLSDQLLYVLCWPPPNRRMDKQTKSLSKYLSKQVSTTSPVEKAARRKSFEKPPVGAKKNMDASELLDKIIQNVITITPAGKAIVKMQSTSSSEDAWLSVYIDGNVLGYCRVIPVGGRPKKERRKSKENNVVPTPAPAPAPPPEPAPAPAPAPVVVEPAKGKDAKKGGKDDKKGKDKKGAKEAEPAPAPAAAPEPVAPVEVPVPAPEEVPPVVEEIEEVEVPLPDTLGSLFYCQTEDGVRIIGCKGPSPTPCLKPDAYGTVMLNVIYSSGLNVSACSNGSVRMTSSVPGIIHPVGLKDPLGIESARYVISGGNIVRVFQSGPVIKDILSPDGTRTLIARQKSSTKSTKSNAVHTPGKSIKPSSSAHSRNTSPTNPVAVMDAAATAAIEAVPGSTVSDGITVSESKSADALEKEASQITDVVTIGCTSEDNGDDEEEDSEIVDDKASQMDAGIYGTLFENAPAGWKYLRFTVEGTVDCYFCSPGTIPETMPTRHPNLSLIRTDTIDAESNSTIYKYEDGRIIINFANGQREVAFSDQTVFITHPDKSSIHIRRNYQGIADGSIWDMPSIEVDADVDKVCGDHSRGLKIPINKGGEQTRFKVALPDGSALMIKYNTSFVAPTNGSVKLVRRDRTRILATDDGELQYFPPSTWDEKAAQEWTRESCDSSALWKEPSSGISQLSSFTLASQSDLRSPARHIATADGKPATANSDLFSKKSKKKLDKQLSSESIVSKTTAEKDILLTNKAVDLKFTVNLTNLKCFIQDCEHNSFELSLMDPMNPVVSLAGEVQGLLPTAITDNPIEPRVFIVSRTAEATEVVPVQYVSDMEKQVDLCSDIVKSKCVALHQPSELGNASQHNYYLRCRMGLINDKYSFTDVFGERSWLSLRTPATAILNMIQMFESKIWKTSLGRNNRVSSPGAGLNQLSRSMKIFQTLNVEEQMPLSAEGYQRLLGALDSWMKFRTARVATMNRFDIADNRPESELELEEKIKGKLKQAYKIAKIAAQKKKEKDKEMRVAQPLDLDVNAKIVEGEEGEEEEDSVQFSEDENDLDPEEIEIRAAFDTYSQLPPAALGSPDTHALVEHSLSVISGYTDDKSAIVPPIFDGSPDGKKRGHSKKINAPKPVLNVGPGLRAALIQLKNTNISMKLVEQALQIEGLSKASYVSLSDFKGLYFRINAILNPAPNTAMSNITDGEGYDYGNSSSPLRVPIVPMDLGAGGSMNSPSTELSAYWKSPEGHKSGKLIPASAPPINFRPLKWNSSEHQQQQQQQLSKPRQGALGYQHNDDDEKYQLDGFMDNEVVRTGAVTVPAPPGIGGGGMYAAGSALRAARTAALQ